MIVVLLSFFVHNSGQALEVGDALAISVSEAREGLLVDALNFVHVLNEILLGSLLALHN